MRLNKLEYVCQITFNKSKIQLIEAILPLNQKNRL